MLDFIKPPCMPANTRFLLTLIESGGDVAFCDLPSVPPGAARSGAYRLTGGANPKAARRAGEVAKANAPAAYARSCAHALGDEGRRHVATADRRSAQRRGGARAAGEVLESGAVGASGSGASGSREPRGQTDLEFLAEKTLNRSRPEGPRRKF